MIAQEKKHRKEWCQLLQRFASKGGRCFFTPSFLLFLMVSVNLFLQPFTTISAYYYQNSTTPRGACEEVATLELLSHYPQDKYRITIGLEVRDTKVYTIIGYNPTIIDTSNGSNPVAIGEYVYDSGRFYAVTLRGSYLYLGGYYGLEILDVSNPSNITKIGEYNTTGGGLIWSIALQGDYAYMASGTAGLRVVNISDPTKPEEVTRYRNGLQASNVVLRGNLAFVTNSNETDNALVILDVSDPQAITEVGHYEDEHYPEIYGFGLTLNGSYAYLGTFAHGLIILDITNITNPRKIAHCYYGSEPIGVPLNPERVNGVFVYKHYVFEAAGPNGLYILDVSKPSEPALIGKFNGQYSFSSYFNGSILYLEERLDGIFVFKVTFTTGVKHLLQWYIAIILVSPLGITLVIVLILRHHNNRKRYKQYKILFEQNK